jgi:archaellum biogenesis ATPase FlaH
MSNPNTAPGGAQSQTTAAVYTVPLNEMIRRIENEPTPEFIYSGIKEGSVGIVFGPSKSGKTMFCENLGMAIAAQQQHYLGLELKASNPRVLVLSFEEHYTNRTARNKKQAAKMISEHGEEWMVNYMVATDELPQYISTDAHWKLLADIINSYDPGIVILDSVTRMCQNIEESTVAQEFMRRLRHLASVTGTTVLAIHHTHKLFGQPLSMDNIAGSRVVAQELDFMIGINRTPDGKRYVKDVAFRYSPNEKETVTAFTIDEHCWLNSIGEEQESRLLAGQDGRRNDTNGSKILNYLTDKAETESPAAATSALEEHLVPGEMARATLFNQLRKLVTERKIEKNGDQYKLLQ